MKCQFSVFFVLAIATVGALIISQVPAIDSQSIIHTKHNLSVSGPGPVRAAAEDRVCIFCHTPHGGLTIAPLWNRHDPPSAYIPYNSPTLKAQVGQPSGASKLCLSCHDGTIALGDLVSESQPIAMAGSQTMPPGAGLIGTDLRDDHPISFNYFDSLGQAGNTLTHPATWDPAVALDAQSMLQCTTCHDPHSDAFGQFLVMDNQASALCMQCHNQPFFQQTSHAQSGATWNGADEDPWPHTDYPDVRGNACMNCHRSHHAGGPAELLTHGREEETCFVCHNDNVARGDLQAVFEKPYVHPVDRTTGAHEPGESPQQAAEHVECADCHQPHRARQLETQAPLIMGVMEGVSGVDSGGNSVSEALFEYQVCFKCHGEDFDSSLGTIERQVSTDNLLRAFSPSSPSYHPVVSPGRNADVPSLIAPLTPASMIYCSDCHNNDEAGPSGSGVAGPHGSRYEFLLAGQYRTGDNISESPTTYALCYQCHSRTSILGDQSFARHSEHIVDQRISCSVCHDAHGIDFAEGNAMNNAHLMNFDLSLVDPDPVTGRLEYRALGPRSGECFLSCHGVNHSPRAY